MKTHHLPGSSSSSSLSEGNPTFSQLSPGFGGTDRSAVQLLLPKHVGQKVAAIKVGKKKILRVGTGHAAPQRKIMGPPLAAKKTTFFRKTTYQNHSKPLTFQNLPIHVLFCKRNKIILQVKSIWSSTFASCPDAACFICCHWGFRHRIISVTDPDLLLGGFFKRDSWLFRKKKKVLDPFWPRSIELVGGFNSFAKIIVKVRIFPK